MPKAKITKSPNAHSTSSANRTPVKINTGGTPLWYKVLMFGLMLAGLVWLRSTIIPRRFISRTTWRPKSVSPSCLGASVALSAHGVFRPCVSVM